MAGASMNSGCTPSPVCSNLLGRTGHRFGAAGQVVGSEDGNERYSNDENRDDVGDRALTGPDQLGNITARYINALRLPLA